MPETPALAAAAARPARPRTAPLRAALLASLLTGPLAACDAIYDDTKGWANRLEAAILDTAHEMGEPDGVPAPEDATPAPVAKGGEMPAPPAVPVEPVTVAALPAPPTEAPTGPSPEAVPPAEPEGAMADASAALLAVKAEAPAGAAPVETAPAEATTAAVPPAPKRKPAPPAAKETADEALVAAVLHLSSLRSEEAAKREWSDLQRSFPEPLGQLQAEFRRTELGDKGTFYRVLAGPLPSPDAAAEVCAALKAKEARQYCRVLPSKPKA